MENGFGALKSYGFALSTGCTDSPWNSLFSMSHVFPVLLSYQVVTVCSDNTFLMTRITLPGFCACRASRRITARYGPGAQVCKMYSLVEVSSRDDQAAGFPGQSSL